MAKVTPCDHPHPLPIDRWVAMSLLQKSIRRGDQNNALLAGSALLKVDARKLQRRLECIAFEDIGLADIGTCQAVMKNLNGSASRLKWSTVSQLIKGMVEAPKCRAADDLLMGADILPGFASYRLLMRQMSDDALVRTMASDPQIYCRAIALRNLLGTDRGPERLIPGRRGTPGLAFEGLRLAGASPALVALAWEGFRATGSALSPMIALLSVELADNQTSLEDDQLSPAPCLNGVPLWAYDLYSRAGRHALSAFLHMNTETTRWINRHIPARQRIEFLGALIFRVEGQLCRRRLVWPLGRELRAAMDRDCYGPEAESLLMSLASELPVLNAVRLKSIPL